MSGDVEAMVDELASLRPHKDCSAAVSLLCHGAAAMLRAQQAEIERLRRCLGFFASVIKSGEPWSGTCEQEYRNALAGGTNDG